VENITESGRVVKRSGRRCQRKGGYRAVGHYRHGHAEIVLIMKHKGYIDFYEEFKVRQERFTAYVRRSLWISLERNYLLSATILHQIDWQ